MFYRNTKGKVCSPDGDMDCDIVAGVLQGDTLAPYLFIICLDYVLQTSIDIIKKNGFILKKKKTRSRRYTAETITDADYPDHKALANTSTQAESQLHSLGQPAGGIGFDVNVNKTEYMSFDWEEASSTLDGGPLKLGDKFSYLGSSVSSTESDVNIRLPQTLTAIDWLSIICKTDLSNKTGFVPRSGCINTTLWMHNMDADKMHRENTIRELHKNVTNYAEQIIEATLHEATAVRPPPSLKPSK